MESTPLGRSELRVSKVCLGTMTFGEQVDEATAFQILDRALERGVDFFDTAESYSVPARAETFGHSEAILGRWCAARPGVREKVVLATKVSGPSRGADWIRGGATDLKPADIRQACDDSLRRLQTDRIDLYQIHWPNRNVPVFGQLAFDPAQDRAYSSTLEHLQALGELVRAGKVRQIGLSNETPWGVADFLRCAELHGLPRIVSVQNQYTLVNRTVDNGLDEMLYRSGVSLLGYSPLAFGALTGKYDASGFEGGDERCRLAKFASMRMQRWGRRETLEAARLYNALAREHGLAPAEMALRFSRHNWRVASCIVGVTSLAQLEQNLDACAAGPLPQELLAAIDAIRWRHRDPAQ